MDVEKEVETYLKHNPSFVKEWFIKNATPDLVDDWLSALQTNFKSLNVGSSPVKMRSTSVGVNPSQITSSPWSSDQSMQSAVLTKPLGVAGYAHMVSKLSMKGNQRKRRITKTDLAQLDQQQTFMELVRDIANELDLNELCHKILLNVGILTNAGRGSLFLTRGMFEKKLVAKLFDVTQNSTVESSLVEDDKIVIPFGKGIIGTVAETKEPINISNAYEDPRFNQEIDKKTGFKTHSILCMPILSREGEVIGVAQIINKEAGETVQEFNTHDENVFKTYLTFCGIGITNAQMFEMSVMEYKRNQLLLQLAKGIFEEQSSLDNVVLRIMLEAQGLLKCKRCLVYILPDISEEHLISGFNETSETVTRTQTANVIKNVSGNVFFKCFDKTDGMDLIITPEKQIIASVYTKISQYTIETRQTLNIQDCDSSTLFTFNTDPDSEFKAQSMICIPIYNGQEKVIGCAQCFNKINGQAFNISDQNVFEAFAIFCGLGIHNTLMYEGVYKLMAKQRVALEVLSYHATAQDDEVERVLEKNELIYNLYDFGFNDISLADDETIMCCIQMFTNCDLMNKFNIPQTVLCRWLLSVKKNYRHVTYHNWRHALNVAQTMFTMLSIGGMGPLMSDLEKFTLLVACLCHDLDHRGTNNAFQSKIDSPLAQLYGTSTMEHHHFDHCIMILNSEGNNIFQSLSTEEYRVAITILEHAILSTDLALYFKKRGNFISLVDAGETEWCGSDKKDLLRGMMMTACDVSAITKPWEIQKEVAQLVSAEFFEQGDIEKTKLHEQPIAMMDREKKDELPKMQVGFIDAICLPIYKTFAELWPGLQPMLTGCASNRQNWVNSISSSSSENIGPPQSVRQLQPQSDSSPSEQHSTGAGLVQ